MFCFRKVFTVLLPLSLFLSLEAHQVMTIIGWMDDNKKKENNCENIFRVELNPEFVCVVPFKLIEMRQEGHVREAGEPGLLALGVAGVEVGSIFGRSID